MKVLKPNVLTPGASYMFTLKVSDGSKIGSSTVVVRVRSGPTSGSFEVTPTTLKTLQNVKMSGKFLSSCSILKNGFPTGAKESLSLVTFASTFKPPFGCNFVQTNAKCLPSLISRAEKYHQ